MKKYLHTSKYILLFANDDRTMTSGWQGTPDFRRYGRERVYKTGDFVKQKLGGLSCNDSTFLDVTQTAGFN